MSRIATLSRVTSETNISLTLDLDGSGRAEVATGIGFLDHMLTSLARHALFDLTIQAEGGTRQTIAEGRGWVAAQLGSLADLPVKGYVKLGQVATILGDYTPTPSCTALTPDGKEVLAMRMSLHPKIAPEDPRSRHTT